MGEILFFTFVLALCLLFSSFSFLGFVTYFFLSCILGSLILGCYLSGWLGVIFFLVFIGGILVLIFYLGLFGSFYGFGGSGFGVLAAVFLFPLGVLLPFKGFSVGESSDYMLSFFMFFLVSGFLFLVLNGVSKVVGGGGALRRFY